MYLPRTLPLCEPHVATWIGKSGRRYDFAVSRPAATWLDEAAVFLLVRVAAEHTDVLHIGHTCSLHKRFGAARDRCPEIWRRALAAGMTHVHLRFEACTERARQAEVDDLLAVLKPSLVLQPSVDDAPAVETLRATAEVVLEPLSEDVLIPYRARLKVTRMRDPHIDIEAFDADLARSDLPFGHAFESPRSHRADPARDCDVIHDDLDAVAVEPVVVEAAAPVVILPATPATEVALMLPAAEPAATDLYAAEPAVAEAAIASTAPTDAAVPPAETLPTETQAPFASAEPVTADVAEPVAEPPSAEPADVSPLLATEAASVPAAADARLEVIPHGEERRSPGLFGRLLRVVSGRGWFSASRSQPSSSPPAGLVGPSVGLSDDPQGDSPPAAADAVGAAAAPVFADAPAANEAEPVTEAVTGAEVIVAVIVDGVSASVREQELERAETESPMPLLPVDTDQPDVIPVRADGSDEGTAVPQVMDDNPVLPAAARKLEAETHLSADDERLSADDESVPVANAEAALAEMSVPAVPTPVPAAPPEPDAGRLAAGAAKRVFACDPRQPLVLFADSVSGEAGADILADAVFTVCGTDGDVQFIFAGDGELRAELGWRADNAGIGERCRFLGDVPGERFRELLLAADILVIPARASRGDALANIALRHGKWVLATHQAQVGCIVHGENGLLTYDNPGSLVWGIRELLGRVRRQQCAARAEAA